MAIPQDDVIDFDHGSEILIFGGDLHLCVRGVRFCVHSYFLERDSQYWRGKLSNAQFPFGSDEANPINLDEDPGDFGHFLWVFYNPHYSIYEASCGKWLAILRLAAQWGCPNIQDFALSYLKVIPMDPWQRIAILQKYDVPLVDQLPVLVELASLDDLTDNSEICEATLTRIKRAHARLLDVAGPRGPPLGTICEALDYEERSQIVTQVFAVVPEQFEPKLFDDHNVESNTEARHSESNLVVAIIIRELRADKISSEAMSDWEMIPASGNGGTSAPTEIYTRLPVMLHDLILPYCLIISFICALIT